MIGQLKPCVSAKALPSADYHDSTDVIKEEEEGESAGNNVSLTHLQLTPSLPL